MGNRSRHSLREARDPCDMGTETIGGLPDELRSHLLLSKSDGSFVYYFG